LFNLIKNYKELNSIIISVINNFSVFYLIYVYFLFFGKQTAVIYFEYNFDVHLNLVYLIYNIGIWQYF